MTDSAPIAILCRYRVKAGKEQEFQQILSGHWKVLHDAGLSTDEPARLHRGTDQGGNIAFVEQFSWKNEASAGMAHQTAAVMKVWEPMGDLCEDMEFWRVGAIDA